MSWISAMFWCGVFLGVAFLSFLWAMPSPGLFALGFGVLVVLLNYTEDRDD